MEKIKFENWFEREVWYDSFRDKVNNGNSIEKSVEYADSILKEFRLIIPPQSLKKSCEN